jgi:zinc protease
MSQRVLGPLLYGPGHPYGIPLTGTGTEASVARIAREDLKAHHGTWFRPGNSVLVVAGDLSMADLLPVVQRHFGGWEKGTVPARGDLPAPPAAGTSRIWILDRPGAPQSSITAAQFVPARGGDGEAPLEVLHAVLGGMFTSRLNMNLREDKHWAYGAGSRIRSVRGPRPLVAGASVQTDRTAESVAEILKEFRGLAGAKPVTEAEREAAVASLTLSLPGRWETGRAVSESVQEIVLHGLPDRWFDGHPERIRAADAKALAAAGALLRPDHLVWIVVGDRRKIEAGLRALGIGEVTVLDADGRPVE